MHLILAFLRRYFVFFGVMLVGAIVIAACALLVQKQMRSASLERLKVIATGQAGQLEDRLVQQQEVLLGLQAALTLNPNLDRLQFYNLLLQSNVMYRQPSLLAVGLARPVALQDIPDHIARVRADRRVAPLAYQKYQPAPLTERKPLLLEHLYPINRLTEQLIGSNLAEAASLKEGLEIARDSGRMLASPAFHLNGHDESIFCLYAPIYDANLPIEPTVAERRAHHAGTVLAYIRLDEFVRPMSKMTAGYSVSWRLFDQGYALQTWRQEHRASEVMESDLDELTPIKQTIAALVHLPGRQWRIEFHAHEEIISEHDDEWIMLAMGFAMLCVLLVAAMMQFLYLSRQWSLQMLLKARGDESNRHQQAQLLAQVVQESHDGLVLRQPDGKIIYANDTAHELFSASSNNLLGRYDVLLSQSELGDLAHPLSFSTTFPRHSPHAKHLDVMLQPLRNELLQPIAMAMIVRDVSLNYAETQELKDSHHRLQEMVDLSSDWFWEQDADSRFTMVTGGFFSRFDVTPAYFLGKHRWDLGSGGLSQEQWDEHRAILAARQAYRDFEYTSVLGRDTIIVSVSGFPFYDDDDNFLGYRGTGRDVTGIRMAQKALISEQQRAQATLESIADGVITTDIFGRVDYLNPVASSLVGWELSSARGQMLSAIYQSVDRQTRLPLPDLVAEVLSDGGEYHGARRSVLLNKFGLNFQVEECAARIRDEHSRTIGAVLVFRDISNWREIEDRAELDV
ncbi:PAS domain S-box protein [Chitinibacter fontanus]|uniref:PAS domain S-box protein n=1 Tax=Chitinibacter fontanus TaxID=1737446 RepID=A0A7D5V8U0_9NEIS|nr:PAS domain-containing protein [Chitinibacter fontanus]QLI80975.1 PAS domain S-box protein [Chitinibacter fontanus]